MHSRQSGALLFCACSVPAVLLLPKLHPAAVVIAAAAAIGVWSILRGGSLQQSRKPVRLAVSVLLLLLLGRAAQFTGVSYPTASHVVWMDLMLLALSVYASTRDIASILRVSAICFFFLTVIYTLIAVFSVKNINVIYPTGLLRPNLGYTALAWVFLPIVVCLHEEIGVKENRGIWTAALFLLFSLPTVLVWISQSRDFADVERFPFYAMVKTIRAFGIMERLEPILSAALTLGNFCLMSILSALLRKNVQTVLPACKESVCTTLIFSAAALICSLKSALPDILIAVAAPLVLGMTAIEKTLQKNAKKSKKAVDKRGSIW